jgi:glycosyltransferase involved in cell wall biosynthesis
MEGARMSTSRSAIIVPLYNEQDVLPELCERLRAAVTHLPGPAGIIFVNDGSDDGTSGIPATSA